MVKETTIILMDTSDYMGYYESQRYLDQLDAMELYIELILKPHPEHYVGVAGLGRTGLKSVLLMQGDDFQTAKNQFDKVHFDNLKPHGGNDNTQDRKRKRENKVQDEGRERYADRYDRKHDDRGNVDTRDRKQKRDDKGHDEGKETTYRDRGDRYGRKRDNRGHDEGRESYGDRGDMHDRKRNYRGHDEGRESYDDRGGRYGRKRDYKDHDEGKDTGLGMVEYKRGRDESASSRSWIVKVIIS
ncbi:hypothetical protein CTI12_AA015120 [Artemisia annua]|uniref:Uncharacterized protein n=1 Tax=Artemisia annua TaxID=35608 RepID=A0A2U1QL46_ARTAN|nr:hypothetical protein CTI12_AA015120 [Artemisia annua]